MADSAPSEARREVRRCQASIDRGCSVEFWLGRLQRAALNYEAAAAILRMQMAAMVIRIRGNPGGGETP